MDTIAGRLEVLAPARQETAEKNRLAEFLTTLVVVLGATSIHLGIIWDISWHMTIGRDTFWTPAHLAIYLGGAIGGCLCGWLAIKTTYFSDEYVKARSVNLWGGRAPFGAWIVIWGALTMITAGPFDDWWHNAYGLDVKIISPPHIVLFLGIAAVVIGALLLVLRGQNQSSGRALAWSKGLFVYVGGIMLGIGGELFLNESWPNRQHNSVYFFFSSCAYPAVLIAIARASKLKWAATAAACAYLLLSASMIWILPLFAAVPKLGPIYTPVTHMVPHSFPSLLVFPAILIDLLKQHGGFSRTLLRDWVLTAIAALAFLAVFVPIQWKFSEFMLTPAANNWFFAGNRYWPYTFRGYDRQTSFWGDSDALEFPKLLRTGLAAFISTRIGLSLGNWMVKVCR